ncbi:FAD binding domain-containing protein [Pseudonocardia hispaniensis]|uniref:FAD binding domain-containing protein n=1 Tax=Pseudonocardia hispaniensis TaxID=904933 RepID=A0ABW1IWK2_9PSEU
MKPPRFLYCDPETIEDAVALKAQHGHDSLILAGGQSLMPMLNMRLANPDVVIDINGITDLQRIVRDGEVLEIGAGVRQSALETDPLVAEAVPLLAQVVPNIGHVENRHRGTVGGSVAHSDAAAELPCAAVTLDAVVVVQGPAGRREVPARDFFQGFLTNACAADEIVVAIRFPVTAPAAGTAFVEVARRQGDFALAAAAAVVELDADGRFVRPAVGVAGIAATPVRASDVEQALTGQQADPDTIAVAARHVAPVVTAAEDLHASAAYRRHLAVTVVQRALIAAVADAVNRSNP